MLKVVPGVFDSASCHFPTEDLQREPESLRSVPVSLNSLEGAPNGKVSGDVLLAAWSVVLRYYVGSDVISFGQIDDTVGAASRFAKCHGDIPAETPLKSLCGLVQTQSGEEDRRQSPQDWMKTCSSINTVVWKKSASSSVEFQDLENTQVQYQPRIPGLIRYNANRVSLPLS